MQDLIQRIEELEIQVALQNEWLQKLNDIVAQQTQTLDFQQAQLRLLYGKIQADPSETVKSHSLSDEIPPHY